ncbi:unnamed protein product [Hyaloperonospora brassicae]|uniref:Elongation factor Ts, mitochondrial n=1 Tax=Hyaloperonospora brassicae TaxID=162125 RepID=A0AAV0UZG9_HYABA|nr:unnamed protein product [Hyaloperonospora brassicae]
MAFASLVRRVRPAALRPARRMSTYKPDLHAVKQLRAESQAPLQDVRNALVATHGDFRAAVEWLRLKGLATAGQKAGRRTAEGLVGVHVSPDGRHAAMVEVNSETDFVARNATFQALVTRVAAALTTADPTDVTADRSAVVTSDALSADQLAVVHVDGTTVAGHVPALVGVVGENVVAARAVRCRLTDGLICSYVHNAAAPGLGRSAALVALAFESRTASADQLAQVHALGRRLAMHVVATRPQFLSRAAVPAAVVASERAFLAAQVQDAGKPPHIAAKMLDGRLAKFFTDVALLEQDHVVEEGGPKVGAFVADAADKLGLEVSVVAFERFEVGESRTEDEQRDV